MITCRARWVRRKRGSSIDDNDVSRLYVFDNDIFGVPIEFSETLTQFVMRRGVSYDLPSTVRDVLPAVLLLQFWIVNFTHAAVPLESYRMRQ